MNILTDKLPESVMLSGKIVPIHADHRSCIRAIIALLDDDSLTEKESGLNALLAFYPEIPVYADIGELFAAMTEFLHGAPTPQLPGQKVGNGAAKERAYSFLYDQEAIFAAFWQQYQIDLSSVTLHWWQFKALLDHMHDNHMAEIMNKRTMLEESGMDSAQRKQLRKEKAYWGLPALAQETKQSDAIAQALLAGDTQALGVALGRS